MDTVGGLMLALPAALYFKNAWDAQNVRGKFYKILEELS